MYIDHFTYKMFITHSQVSCFHGLIPPHLFLIHNIIESKEKHLIVHQMSVYIIIKRAELGNYKLLRAQVHGNWRKL